MKKILLVDPEAESRKKIRSYLSEHDFDVIQSSIKHALDDIRTNDIPVVLISNHRLIGTSFLDLVAEINEKGDCKIILIGDEVDNEVADYGVFDCVDLDVRKIERSIHFAIDFIEKDRCIRSLKKSVEIGEANLNRHLKTINILKAGYTQLVQSL